jgi:hypothetical protein
MMKKIIPILYWVPRILGIIFILFISIFALDVFGEGLSFWHLLLALMMHLIPTFLLIGALLISWKWEIAGVIIYPGLGLWYLFTTHTNFIYKLPIFIPCLLIGGLFAVHKLAFNRNSNR